MGSEYAPRKLKRVVIREELVELTGDHLSALLLNQLLYWTERMRDLDAYIAEEKRRDASAVVMPPTFGWIYKSAQELIDELMVSTSVQTLLRRLDALIKSGVIDQRHNPDRPYDRRMHYRVNYAVLQRKLLALGYSLEGYALFGDFSGSAERLGHHRPFSTMENASSTMENGSSTMENGSSMVEDVKGTETTVETTAETTTAAGSRVRANGAAHPPDEERGGGGGGDEGPPGDRGPVPPDVRSALVNRLTSEAKLRPKQAAAVVRSGLVSKDADVDRCVAFVQSSDAEKPAAVLWSEWLSQGQLPPAPEGQPPGRPTDAMSEAEILAFYDRMNRERYQQPVPAGRGVP